MKTLTVIVAALILSLVSAVAAAAGSWPAVTVSEIGAYTAEGQAPSGMIYVWLSSNGSGNASCATVKNVIVVDTTTSYGAFAATVLLAARMSGNTVNVGGTGSCGLVSGYETLSSVGY